MSSPHPNANPALVPDQQEGSTRARPAASVLAIGISLAVLTALLFCSVQFGVRTITFNDALTALFGHTETAGQAAASSRIPRTILAVLVGAALAVSGTAFQAVTRNPLADPGVFGVLSGASLAVVIALAFFGIRGATSTMMIAIVGSALAAILVYAIGSFRGATPIKLALAGAVVAAASSSLSTAILLPRQNLMEYFRFWQIGGVGGASWDRMAKATPLLLLGFVLCWAMASGMNALALGDEAATALGKSVPRVRSLCFVGGVVLAGIATSLAGPIAFVGLVVPHFNRILTGVDHRLLIPLNALTGAALLVAADTIGRVVAKPEEIAVGVMMPLIGAPLFIWIVRSQKVRDL